MSTPNGCFDWASSFYEYTRAVPADLINKTIKIIQEKICFDSSSKVLEVGIGTGRIGIPISKKLNLDIVGIDLSDKMLQKCLKKVLPTDNVHLVVADGLSLPFSKNQFEIILTCHVLHFFPDAFQFIRNILPLLIQNGYHINLDVYVDYSQTLPYKIYYDKLAETGFHYSPKGDLIQKKLNVYLTKRGWKHIQYKVESTREISIDNLVHFIRDRVFSHQRSIEDSLHDQSLKHLYQELERNNVDLAEKILAPATSRINIFQSSYSQI